MTPGAAIFMALSWAGVLGLTLWSFVRILRNPRDARQAGSRASGTDDKT